MNAVQAVLVVLFLVSVVAAYWKNIGNFVSSRVGKITGQKPSIAVELVDDLLAVTQLRDRLAAEGYQEGVDACTVLLRVIVEHNHTTKGAV
ncbi:MAG: hypothetical protein EBV03_09680 [Proteobacteria bacterium]|nr:hypothetical protein [Pseudomonadota bacterium]